MLTSGMHSGTELGRNYFCRVCDEVNLISCQSSLLIVFVFFLIPDVSRAEEYLPVRLAGSDVVWAGRVEVNTAGTGDWGNVCDDGWDMADARVVCRQLGFLRVDETVTRGNYGNGSGVFRMTRVSCHGSEASLDKCQYEVKTAKLCQSFQTAGVVCDPQKTATPVRLRGRQVSYEGRVEINVRGRGGWGLVCGENAWSMKEANVVCRQMGFANGATNAYTKSGGGDFRVRRITCKGTENTLDKCQHSRWNLDTDSCSKIAWVECYQTREIPGCYTGKLPIHAYGGQKNSHSYCRLQCILRNVPYSGVYNGKDCFCGQSIHLSVVKSSTCDNSCPDDVMQKCGAHDKTWVMRTFEDCLPDPAGVHYRGTQSFTEDNLRCQRWDSQTPHTHDGYPSYYAENFCRNDHLGRPWCFTEDKTVRRSFCNIPLCKACKTDKKGASYRGLIHKTRKGTECQRWSAQRPHTHPAMPVYFVENYCRNWDGIYDGINGESEPWCFAMDPNTRWDFCDIPWCPETGMVDSNTTVLCYHGGTYDVVNGMCLCPAGFTGADCSQDIDECAAKPYVCSPHASCSNSLGSFVCTCADGFIGDGIWCDVAVVEVAPPAGVIVGIVVGVLLLAMVGLVIYFRRKRNFFETRKGNRNRNLEWESTVGGLPDMSAGDSSVFYPNVAGKRSSCWSRRKKFTIGQRSSGVEIHEPQEVQPCLPTSDRPAGERKTSVGNRGHYNTPAVPLTESESSEIQHTSRRSVDSTSVLGVGPNWVPDETTVMEVVSPVSRRKETNRGKTIASTDLGNGLGGRSKMIRRLPPKPKVTSTPVHQTTRSRIDPALTHSTPLPKAGAKGAAHGIATPKVSPIFEKYESTIAHQTTVAESTSPNLRRKETSDSRKLNLKETDLLEESPYAEENEGQIVSGPTETSQGIKIASTDPAKNVGGQSVTRPLVSPKPKLKGTPTRQTTSRGKEPNRSAQRGKDEIPTHPTRPIPEYPTENLARKTPKREADTNSASDRGQEGLVVKDDTVRKLNFSDDDPSSFESDNAPKVREKNLDASGNVSSPKLQSRRKEATGRVGKEAASPDRQTDQQHAAAKTVSAKMQSEPVATRPPNLMRNPDRKSAEGPHAVQDLSATAMRQKSMETPKGPPKPPRLFAAAGKKLPTPISKGNIGQEPTFPRQKSKVPLLGPPKPPRLAAAGGKEIPTPISKENIGQEPMHSTPTPNASALRVRRPLPIPPTNLSPIPTLKTPDGKERQIEQQHTDVMTYRANLSPGAAKDEKQRLSTSRYLKASVTSQGEASSRASASALISRRLKKSKEQENSDSGKTKYRLHSNTPKAAKVKKEKQSKKKKR